MTDALSLSATRSAARAASREASAALGAALAIEALAGLALLVAPVWSAAQAGIAAGEGARIAGALLIGVALLQTPALGDPGRNRIVLLGGVFVRLLVGLTALFCVAGLNLFGLVELAFAAAIYLTFRRMVIATVSSRP